MALFFDIETGGLSGLESSIYSLSHQRTGPQGGKRVDLYADPALGSRMYRWSEKNVWAEVKQKTNRMAEKDLLSRWIKVLQANTGEELIGWNIGFDVQKQIPFREKGRSFDIPMTLARAAEYGMEDELASAYRGMSSIRDIGREYAVAISRQVTANMPALEGKIDPAILEQAFKFSEASQRAAEVLPPGASLTDIARQVSRRGFSMAGWKQEQVTALLDLPEYAAHGAEDVTALTRFPSAESLRLSETQLVKWGKGALKSSLVGQALTTRRETPPRVSWEPIGGGRSERVMSAFDKPTDYWDYLTSRAKAGGITDFESTVAARAGTSMSRVRRGLGVAETFQIVGEGVKTKISPRLPAFDLSGVPLKRIGLGIGAIAGTAWLANTLFSGFDDEYNTIEGLGEEGIAARLRKVNSDFGSGWQGLPSSLHGQPIDPRILSFRGSIWDDMDARANFQAELELRQQNHNREIGSFKAAEMFNVNASVYKSISRRNHDMKLIRLSRYDVDVEDADTLVLRRKGLSGLFSKDVQVRLAGIDAPEVAGHEGDPLDFIRMWQAQPGGEEASEVLRSIMAENENAQLLVDSKRKTYGRYLGAVIGNEGQNINLELIRRGAVTALPFGPSEFDILQRGAAAEAEGMAHRDRRGIWQLKRYQASALTNAAIGRPLTHNMLTRIDKMGANLSVGAYSSFLADFGSEQGELTAQEMAQARRMGRALRKTHGPYKIPKKTDSNTIEGLGHKGISWRIRQSMTDFGSGWIRKAVSLGIGQKAIGEAARRAGKEVMTTSVGKMFAVGREVAAGGMGSVRAAQSLATGEAAIFKQASDYGEKIFKGITDIKRTPVGGNLVDVLQVQGAAREALEGSVSSTAMRDIKVASEKLLPASTKVDKFLSAAGEEMSLQTRLAGTPSSMSWEAKMQSKAHKLMPENVPAVLGETQEGFFSAWAGKPVAQKDLPSAVNWAEKAFKDLMASKQGVAHLDPHMGQVLMNPKTGKFNIIDWGVAVGTRSRPAEWQELGQDAISMMMNIKRGKEGMIGSSLYHDVSKLNDMVQDFSYSQLALGSSSRTGPAAFSPPPKKSMASPGTKAPRNNKKNDMKMARRLAQADLQRAASKSMSEMTKKGGRGHLQQTGKPVLLSDATTRGGRGR